jgi:L-alanine-DL-glutamate epimerase-like enolase superfamily enzyme
VAWGLTLTHGALSQDVAARPLPAGPSHADCLDRPGLGVEVDEDCVRRHQVRMNTRHVA